MNFARNSSEEVILLISQEPEKLLPVFSKIEKTNPEINIVITKSGVEGFELFRINKPCLTIISDRIHDIPGVSVATVLKESVNLEPDATIWLIDVENISYNMQADLFFPANMDDMRFFETLKNFLATRTLNRVQYGVLNSSRESQKDKVPHGLSNKLFDLNIIYSPFSQSGLSGDGISYTYDEKSRILSGYVYDIEGHDLIAYYNSGRVASQINSAIRYSTKTSVGFTLADVFEQVNIMYCDLLDRDQKTTAALMFKVYFDKKKMFFCSAGINFFLIKRKGSNIFEKIRMKNPLLGWDATAKYRDYEIDISNVEKIYLSTDGFYNLLIPDGDGKDRDYINVAKKDDMTLMMITLKEQKEDMK